MAPSERSTLRLTTFDKNSVRFQKMYYFIDQLFKLNMPQFKENMKKRKTANKTRVEMVTAGVSVIYNSFKGTLCSAHWQSTL